MCLHSKYTIRVCSLCILQTKRDDPDQTTRMHKLNWASEFLDDVKARYFALFVIVILTILIMIRASTLENIPFDMCAQYRDQTWFFMHYNGNALKNHVRSLLLHQSENICYISSYFLHYFVLPFQRCLANAICTDYARSRAEQYTSRNGSKFVAPVR